MSSLHALKGDSYTQQAIIFFNRFHNLHFNFVSKDDSSLKLKKNQFIKFSNKISIHSIQIKGLAINLILKQSETKLNFPSRNMRKIVFFIRPPLILYPPLNIRKMTLIKISIDNHFLRIHVAHLISRKHYYH